MGLRVKNWAKHQHFKDRRPPWIKLYRDLLEDMEWHELDPVAAKALVMIWLIASEADGELPELKKLAFRLRMSLSELNQVVSQLSHWVEQSDISAISEGYQSDPLETETETEEERETEEEAETPARAPRKQAGNLEPQDLVPEGVELQHAKDWRKARKSPITPTAWEELKAQAVKAGITPGEAVRICAAKGWRGFDASWNWKGNARASPISPSSTTSEAARLLGFIDEDVIDA
jgi:hypothetical protein